jgi:hypothetical protein
MTARGIDKKESSDLPQLMAHHTSPVPLTGQRGVACTTYLFRESPACWALAGLRVAIGGAGRNKVSRSVPSSAIGSQRQSEAVRGSQRRV